MAVSYKPVIKKLDRVSVEAPAGVDTNVQYNDSGAFGGDANFTWNKTTQVLGVDGNIDLSTTTANVGQIVQDGEQLLHTYGGNTQLFLGAGSGNFTQTGNTNVGIGRVTLAALTTGTQNMALGAYSMQRNQTGLYNSGIGAYSLRNNVDGDDNAAIGRGALECAVGADVFKNTGIGTKALSSLTTGGNNNIAIGYYAGDNLTTGSNNILIGHDIEAQAVNSDNTLSIGNMIFATGLDGVGKVASTGNVGIGIATPNRHLVVYENSSAGSILQFANSTTGSSASTDGFEIGLDGSENASLFNRENTAMRFRTNNTQRMEIDASGNVLISATAGQVAEGRFHIEGDGDNPVVFISQDTAGAVGMAMDFPLSSGRPIAFYDNGTFIGGIDYNFGGNYWSFDVTNAAGTRQTNAFTIASENDNNYVGMGVNDADERLEVSGNVRLTTDGDAYYVGTGKDAHFTYDGTDAKIVTDNVAASDLVVDCGTAKTLKLQEAVYGDLTLPLATGRTPANAPTFAKLKDNGSGSTGVYAWHFADNQVNEVHMATEFSHDVKLNGYFDVHIHWCATTANAGNVRLEVEYGTVALDGTMGNTTVTQVTAAATGTAYEFVMTEMVTLSASSRGISDQVFVRAARLGNDAADTLTGDIVISTVGIHYEIDTLGSRQEYVK